jgi:hypothetical protein
MENSMSLLNQYFIAVPTPVNAWTGKIKKIVKEAQHKLLTNKTKNRRNNEIIKITYWTNISG